MLPPPSICFTSNVCIVTILLAVTLIRSMRLYGGSLNEASFTAFIPLLSGESFTDPDGLVEKLGYLNVRVDFIQQTKSPSPKTLNKLAAWARFDYSIYDYLLWLDADIVVFSDPIPLLEASMGEVTTLLCAPEIYGYMRRYPHVNSSSIFWNPALPNFYLIGNSIILCK